MSESAFTHTRTPKKHRRVYVACVACRKRKIKCVASDADSSPCARCAREGVPCEYIAVDSSGPSSEAQGRSRPSNSGGNFQPGDISPFSGYPSYDSTRSPGHRPSGTTAYPYPAYRPDALRTPETPDGFHSPPMQPQAPVAYGYGQAGVAPMHMHGHAPPVPQYFNGPNQQPMPHPSGSYSGYGASSFYNLNPGQVYAPQVVAHDNSYQFQAPPPSECICPPGPCYCGATFGAFHRR
ncbi:hypothetical protein B0H17DRAFT_1095249 [Mycena rosella]|uniref:Zn(2)-C6 fungal-type domain-containing protein n=1 Tax=Mycena rosella TaxID=1033263 RepID=A0AAD7G6E2_MYCRO|nr:hypothetical protein B0H17DRAFT_1095249 [Mycena rosella]